MDLSVYLIAGAVIVLAVIIFNHQKEKKKMKHFLGASTDIQPIFLMKSVEKKNKALADILYDGGAKPLAAGGPSIAIGPKLALIKELEKLEQDYAGKKILLRVYDKQLFDLLEKAKKLQVTT
jgi:hypothetical protein